MKRSKLHFLGWGLVGPVKDNMTGNLDVTGYNEGDYWRGGKFLGPDPYGVVPIYRTARDRQYPAGAVQYPYRA
jgi:hypothetical protein